MSEGMSRIIIFSIAAILLPRVCSARESWEKAYQADTNTVFLCHWDNPNDKGFESAEGVKSAGDLDTKSVPAYVRGKWGKGIEFSSRRAALLYPADSNLSFHIGTVEFWFKPTSPDWNDKTHCFFALDTRQPPSWKNRFTLQFHINSLRFVVGDKNGDLQYYEVPDVFLNVGQWYHLAFSWKTNQGAGNDAVRTFCNGHLIGEWSGLTINLADAPASHYMIVGSQGAGSEYSASGVMDEFRISDNWRQYRPARRSKSLLETNVLSTVFPKDWDWENELEKAKAMPIPEAKGKLIHVSCKAAPGGDGSEEKPFATIGDAAKVARRGDRLIVGGGLYRETVPVKSGLQVFARDGEEVILSGSREVTGWTRDENVNCYAADDVGLEYGFPLEQVVPKAGNPGIEGPNLPYIVFCDGKLLTRCNNAESFKGKEKAFYWDRAGSRMHIRLAGNEDPSGHLIEVGIRMTAFDGEADDIVLHGLTITHYANPTWYRANHGPGALMISGDRWLVEDCSVLWNANMGLMFGGSNNIVRNCRCNYNGWMGFFAYAILEHNKVIDCEACYNNWKSFNHDLGSGGMKLMFTRRYIVAGCVASYNNGPGIWFDERCRGNVLTDNVTCSNMAHAGIMYEVSYGGLIRNNFSAFNTDSRWPIVGNGILLQLSAGCKVENNIFMENQNGVVITQGDRLKSSAKGSLDSTWFSCDNLIRSNTFVDNKGWELAIVFESKSRPSFDDFRNISRGNIFVSSTGDIKMLWNDLTTLKDMQEHGYEKGSKLIVLTKEERL